MAIKLTDQRIFSAFDFTELSTFVPPAFTGWTYAELETGNTAYRWNSTTSEWEFLGDIIPARTLFVSLAWPAGANPAVFFTTIQPALNQAATMSPTADSPIVIVISPGTYPDPLTLVSNVHMSGTGGYRSVLIRGAVTWTPTDSVREEVGVELIAFLSSITIDTSGKTGDNSTFDARDSSFRAGVTHLARPSNSDFFQAWSIVTTNGPGVFTNTNVNLFSCSTSDMTFNGAAAIDMRGCEVFGTLNMLGTTVQAFVESTQIAGKVFVATGTSAVFTGSIITGSVTVAAGGSADLRMATWGGLLGPGPIGRSLWNFSTAATAIGANAIVVDPPFPSGNYNVSLTQTGGPLSSMPVVSAKTGSGFTLTDDVAGRTFDVTISFT